MEDNHGQLLGVAEDRVARERRTVSKQRALVVDTVEASRQWEMVPESAGDCRNRRRLGLVCGARTSV
jgi:hypothetical protein